MSFLLFVFVGLCFVFFILDPWVSHTQDLAAPEPQMSFNLFSLGQVTILLGQTSFISTVEPVESFRTNSSGPGSVKPVGEMDASILSLEQPLLNAAQKLLY